MIHLTSIHWIRDIFQKLTFYQNCKNSAKKHKQTEKNCLKTRIKKIDSIKFV